MRCAGAGRVMLAKHLVGYWRSRRDLVVGEKRRLLLSVHLHVTSKECGPDRHEASATHDDEVTSGTWLLGGGGWKTRSCVDSLLVSACLVRCNALACTVPVPYQRNKIQR